MKKLTFLIRKILLLVLFISTIIMFWIVYKDVDNVYVVKFAIGYIILLILSSFYFTIIIIFKIKKLTKYEVRKRMKKFIIEFILFLIFNYLIGNIFKSVKVDLLNNLSISSGMSFGINFLDLIFKKSNNDDEYL